MCTTKSLRFESQKDQFAIFFVFFKKVKNVMKKENKNVLGGSIICAHLYVLLLFIPDDDIIRNGNLLRILLGGMNLFAILEISQKNEHQLSKLNLYITILWHPK